VSTHILPSRQIVNLLESPRLRSWFDSYLCRQAASTAELRRLLFGKCPQGSSRTHKSDENSQCWGLQIKVQDGSYVGIDLEYASEKFINRDLHTASHLLGFNENKTATEILVEWSSREASFKAIQQANPESAVQLSDLRRVDQEIISMVVGPGEINCEVQTVIDGPWVFSIARLRTNSQPQTVSA
jgi:hypothetical protein